MSLPLGLLPVLLEQIAEGFLNEILKAAALSNGEYLHIHGKVRFDANSKLLSLWVDRLFCHGSAK
jgi:hypothetical protein